MKRYLCFDIGGSSGRSVVAHFDGSKFELEELDRFISAPVRMTNGYYYNLLSTITGIKNSIAKAKQKYPDLTSIGIDAFGVDFGLLSKTGEVVASPMCDCDSRMIGVLNDIRGELSPCDLYRRTGSRLDETNTLFQLITLKRQNNPILDIADRLLMYPDLLNYILTGVCATEYSVASTSSLINAQTGKWDVDIINKIGIPADIFTDVVISGEKLAPITKSIADELLIDPINIVTVAEHDTASAVVSCEDDGIFISSGTWSVVGVKTSKPIICDKYSEELSNEGCYDGQNRLIKNIFGLKFLQECKKAWAYAGIDIDYAQMGKQSEEARAFYTFIDPEDMASFVGANMPEQIRRYCAKTKQPLPEEVGEFVRCVNESLAFTYRKVILTLEEATHRVFSKIYIVGGGIQNTQLCQMTANATGKVTITGDKESAALGNGLVQAMADGEISTKNEMFQCAKASSHINIYEPQDIYIWKQQYDRYLNITSSCINETK